MSWQSYVDDQLIKTKAVKHAAIFGQDGNMWAKDKDFQITVSEASTIASHFCDGGGMAKSGIIVAGDKYFYIRGTDKVIQGKDGKKGVVAYKTGRAFILGVYEDPMNPAKASAVIEKLGDFLESVGY